MRQIKFRFWDKFNKQWEKSLYLYIDEEGDIYEIYEGSKSMESYMHRERVNNQYVAIEFAGLKDKNDVDVYDGDIYRNLDSGLIGQFTICDGVGGVYVLCTEYKNGGIYNNLPFWEHDTTNFEVIGNIYENPELLEDEIRVEQRKHASSQA